MGIPPVIWALAQTNGGSQKYGILALFDPFWTPFLTLFGPGFPDPASSFPATPVYAQI